MSDRLVFIRADDALVAGVEELAQRIRNESRPGWNAPAAILLAGDGPRVLGRDDYRQLLARYLALAPATRTADALARLLDDLPPSALAEADTDPGGPAVVIDRNGRLVGAWVPEASSRRGGIAIDLDAIRASPIIASPSIPRRSPSPPADRPASPIEEPRGRPGRRFWPTFKRIQSRLSTPPPVDRAEPAPPETVIERTPHVAAPERIATKPGTRVPLEVWVDTEAMSAVEHGTVLSIALPCGVDELTVGVLVTVSAHFAVDGSPYQQLRIRRDVDASERVSYELVVTDEGEPGIAGVDVLLEYRGRAAGTVRRAWSWAAGAAEAQARPFATEAEPGMALDATDEQPDLSVFITAPENDDMTFACSVQTSLLDGYAEPTPGQAFKLPQRADEFVVKKLEAIADVMATPEDRLRALKAAGVAFWEAVPAAFHDVLFAMEDAGKRPRHVFIASIEPNLPWELMIPSRIDGDGIAQDWPRPLGAELAVGRWTRTNPRIRGQRLPVRNAFVVAPEYTGERVLDASKEIALLADRLAGVRTEPATIEALDRRFAAESASVLHFVCHGAAGVADDDAIYLDREEQLTAGVVRILGGFKALCAKERPLVFLNSCETGRNVRGLAGATGFPRTFGDLGARAVIAPLWPVEDDRARDVALEVYRRALDDGTPLAEILRDIRARAYEAAPFDDSLAAYCFYGDPLTTLERVR